MLKELKNGRAYIAMGNNAAKVQDFSLGRGSEVFLGNMLLGAILQILYLDYLGE